MPDPAIDPDVVEIIPGEDPDDEAFVRWVAELLLDLHEVRKSEVQDY